MAQTYKATGINLKASPLGENDRLLTVLTREMGLMRLVAPGVRKYQSKLGGRSDLFVINELLLLKGRSLDKILQAETLESYSTLSQDLRKLTAAQYLAELVLFQALSDQPQTDLFDLLAEHLRRLAQLPGALAIAALIHGTFHLLTLAGLSPSVHQCCITQEALIPNFADPQWRVGFNTMVGGMTTLESLPANPRVRSPQRSPARPMPIAASDRLIRTGENRVRESAIAYSAPSSHSASLSIQLSALELAIFQRLAQPELIQSDGRLRLEKVETSQDAIVDPAMAIEASRFDHPLAQPIQPQVWHSVERILRHYVQYHFDRPIRSAALIDTCFPTLS